MPKFLTHRNCKINVLFQAAVCGNLLSPFVVVSLDTFIVCSAVFVTLFSVYVIVIFLLVIFTKICHYLLNLNTIAKQYIEALNKTKEKYLEHFNMISCLVNKQQKVNWLDFTRQEKLIVENTVLLVGMLYKMCKVNLVKKSEKENEINSVNRKEVMEAIFESEKMLQRVG